MFLKCSMSFLISVYLFCSLKDRGVLKSQLSIVDLLLAVLSVLALHFFEVLLLGEYMFGMVMSF